MNNIQFCILILLIGLSAAWVKKQIQQTQRKIVMKIQELVDGITAVDKSVRAVEDAIKASSGDVPETVVAAFQQLKSDVVDLAALTGSETTTTTVG